jgi:hypothetical protein
MLQLSVSKHFPLELPVPYYCVSLTTQQETRIYHPCGGLRVKEAVRARRNACSDLGAMSHLSTVM